MAVAGWIDVTKLNLFVHNTMDNQGNVQPTRRDCKQRSEQNVTECYSGEGAAWR